LPPLRERSDDIALLARHYVDFYAKKYHQANQEPKQLSDSALAAISSYNWPGNIRELRHSIERAMILSQSAMLMPADFQLPLVSASKQSNNATSTIRTPDIASSQSITNPNTASTTNPATALPTELNLEQLEKNAIAMALKKHRFNISHTAKELGLTRAALYRRMEKHGL
jgi:DNA-binding NtrC family response regulator